MVLVLALVQVLDSCLPLYVLVRLGFIFLQKQSPCSVVGLEPIVSGIIIIIITQPLNRHPTPAQWKGCQPALAETQSRTTTCRTSFACLPHIADPTNHGFHRSIRAQIRSTHVLTVHASFGFRGHPPAKHCCRDHRCHHYYRPNVGQRHLTVTKYASNPERQATGHCSSH